MPELVFERIGAFIDAEESGEGVAAGEGRALFLRFGFAFCRSPCRSAAVIES